MRAMVVAALAASLAACAASPSRDEVAAAPGDTAPLVDPSWPASTSAYRTTSAAIYLGNLDARIDELQRAVDSQGLAAHRTSLAGSLYHRYRVLGRTADADQALEQVDAAVAAEPDVPTHRATRAVILAGFHRFKEARADLDAAEANGGRPEDLLATRREIQVALGEYGALADEIAKSSELSHEFLVLANRADLRVQQGDLAGATFRYRAAQSEYRDVNPFPLAWLHVQQGIAYLRFGQVEEARRFFAAAHERMPTYYLATEHLAETETRLRNFDRARALYAQVIEQTGNPEFVAALSGLERDAGNVELADTLAKQASQGYESLLRSNPAAYAQHAADFFIENDDAARADALARENLALRQDIGSWILAAQTAHAVGDEARACEARAHALATGLKPPEMAELEPLAAICAKRAG